MFNNRVNRERLKKGLIYSTIILTAIFFVLLLYILLVLSPKHIEKAKDLGQYHQYHSANLPKGDGEIGYLSEEVPYKENLNQDKKSKPQIAILLTNLGLNQNSTELALTLPKEVSLGFLPYTKKLKPLFKRARDQGAEVFIYLPFETEKYPMDFPGHLPILKSLTSDENIYRMNSHINEFVGIVGVYTSYKEAFISDFEKSSPILNELNQKNLSLFLGRKDEERKFFGERNVRSYEADIILDMEPNVASIKANLDKLIELAKKNNHAIAYAESYPVTIYTLKAWLQNLDQHGVELVPVSSIKNLNIGKHES